MNTGKDQVIDKPAIEKENNAPEKPDALIRGEKALAARRMVDDRSEEEKDEESRKDAEQWRNEG